MKPQPLKRKGAHTDHVRPVNSPQPLRVSVDPQGRPLHVQKGQRGVRVVAVRNQWKIDDRWWTERPVSRMYWEVELEGGLVVTVFQDLLAGGWHEQRYTARPGEM